MKVNQLSAPERFVRWMQEPIRPIGAGIHGAAAAAAPARAPREAVTDENFAAKLPRQPEHTSPSVDPEPAPPEKLQEKLHPRWQQWLSFAYLSQATRRHNCPHCHGHQFRRSHPRSVEWLLCLVRVIPYRCYCCNHRFFGLLLDSNPFAERFSHLP